jgi:dienelactone hydrolase
MRPACLPALLLPVLAACGGEASGPRGPALPYGLGPRPVLPFPSDDVTRPDPTPTGHHLAVGPQGTNLGDVDEALYLLGDDFVGSLAPLDGWSTIGPAFVPTGVAVAPESLEGRVVLVDLDARAPVPATVAAIGGETEYGRPVHWIEARSLRPLAPAHRHALVLLEGLTDEAGAPLTRGETFEALYAGEAAPPGVDAGRWARAVARQAGLREDLAGAGLDPERVLVADPYTTLSVTEETDAMVASLRAAPAPAPDLDADHDGAPDRYLDVADDPRGNLPRRAYPSLRAVLRAEVALPSFRPDDDANLAVSHAAAPIARMEPVEVLITLPQGPGPFPVAVFHHGLGGQKESVFDFVEDLSALGVATVAIDATLHGFRTDKPGNAGVRFLNVVDPALLQDNFRTAQVDQVSVVRVVDALAAMDLMGTGEVLLDPERLLYVGVSLGAIVGAAVVGLEPRFDAAVLFVGGGSLLEFFDRVLSGFEFSGFPTRLFTTVAQTVLDRGDPSNYAARSADTQVLLIQALEDQVVPAGATVSLARAMALPLVGEPYAPVPDLPTAPGPVSRRGWTQYPGTHALPLKASEPYHAHARAQARRFIETWVATGTAEISPP